MEPYYWKFTFVWWIKLPPKNYLLGYPVSMCGIVIGWWWKIRGENNK